MQLTNKQAAAFLDLLAETAIKETKKNGVFVIPGIGRLVKAERKARIGRNPQTGAAIKIKAKTVVKFRVAKAAKDVIAPPRSSIPDCGPEGRSLALLLSFFAGLVFAGRNWCRTGAWPRRNAGSRFSPSGGGAGASNEFMATTNLSG